MGAVRSKPGTANSKIHGRRSKPLLDSEPTVVRVEWTFGMVVGRRRGRTSIRANAISVWHRVPRPSGQRPLKLNKSLIVSKGISRRRSDSLWSLS